MTGAEWALILAVGTLGYLALLASRLVVAIWSGRPHRLNNASVTVAFVLISVSLLSIPRSEQQLTLVAEATSGPSSVAPTVAPAFTIAVSGNRVRLSGQRSDAEGSVWALIEDPRTGSFWLQGPAVERDSRWWLDLVVGSDGHERLPYRVSIMRADPVLHDLWLDEAPRGAMTLPERPTNQAWLLRDREVAIGG